MHRRMFRGLLVAVVLAVGTLPGARAHHSVAMFDTSRLVTVDGVVKEWQWTNPHAWLQLLVDDHGKHVEAGFELRSPNALLREGFRQGSFKPGDKVRVIGNPRRDGGVGGLFLCGRTSSGQWLRSSPTKMPECKD